MLKRRKFTKEEKLKIIREASQKGVVLTLEKYGVYAATYYNWKKKFGIDGGGWVKSWNDKSTFERNSTVGERK